MPLSFFQPGQLQGATPSAATPQGDPAAMVEGLLSTLSRAPQPTPPKKPGITQNIFGNIGDALLAAAAARSGRAPQAMGPYAARRYQEEQDYQQQAMAAQEYNRDLENRARIMLQQQRVRREEKEMTAAARKYTPKESIIDVEGEPHRILHWLDPETMQIMKTQDLGPAGYAPWIYPGEPGVAPPARIPRIGEHGRIGGLPTPPPPTGAAKAIASGEAAIKGFNRLKSDWKNINKYVTEKGIGKGFFGPFETIFKAKVGETEYGGAFEATKEFNKYATRRNVSLNAYVKKQTGAQFSYKELQRYVTMWPQAWDDEETANNKLQILIETVTNDAEALLRMFPAARGSIPKENVDRFEALGVERAPLPDWAVEIAEQAEADAPKKSIIDDLRKKAE